MFINKEKSINEKMLIDFFVNFDIYILSNIILSDIVNGYIYNYLKRKRKLNEIIQII